MLAWSTNTRRSSPNLYSLSSGILLFSKAIEYWKPEQPPPTTEIRRPWGLGSCCAMISATLLMAVSVS
jgi:hypothetical protein